MLPFTREQFFEVFAAHNETIWPAQGFAYVLAGACLLAMAVNHRHARRLSLAVLAILFVWTGIAYHWRHFAAVNPAAFAFAVLFLLQGVLLAIFATRRRTPWRESTQRAAGPAGY